MKTAFIKQGGLYKFRVMPFGRMNAPAMFERQSTSDQDGDEEGAGPEQEEAMGAELSADLALAILNGLDISSLPALRDLSPGASTTVSIPILLTFSSKFSVLR